MFFPHHGIVVSNKTGYPDREQPETEQAYPDELPDMTGTVCPPYWTVSTDWWLIKKFGVGFE